VIGVVGGTVTAAARSTGHWVSFGITLAMMLGLTLYVGLHSRQRWGSHWQKYGPTYMTILASFLVMADLTRHVLEDINWWPAHLSNGWGSAEYKNECSPEAPPCLTAVGILFTIVFTYLGFFILAVATLWNANICDKLKDFKAEWRRLRYGEGQ